MSQNFYQFSYITFRVGKAEYSAKCNKVISIIETNDIPLRNDYTLDTWINLPGQHLYSTVIDLHHFFSEAGENNVDTSRMIIVEIDREKVAFIVDQVIDFFYIEESDPKPLNVKSVTALGDAVIQTATLGDNPIRIIDFEQIMRETQNSAHKTIH